MGIPVNWATVELESCPRTEVHRVPMSKKTISGAMSGEGRMLGRMNFDCLVVSRDRENVRQACISGAPWESTVSQEANLKRHQFKAVDACPTFVKLLKAPIEASSREQLHMRKHFARVTQIHHLDEEVLA